MLGKNLSTKITKAHEQIQWHLYKFVIPAEAGIQLIK
jgi:hypothetical protein